MLSHAMSSFIRRTTTHAPRQYVYASAIHLKINRSKTALTSYHFKPHQSAHSRSKNHRQDWQGLIISGGYMLFWIGLCTATDTMVRRSVKAEAVPSSENKTIEEDNNFIWLGDFYGDYYIHVELFKKKYGTDKLVRLQSFEAIALKALLKAGAKSFTIFNLNRGNPPNDENELFAIMEITQSGRDNKKTPDTKKNL